MRKLIMAMVIGLISTVAFAQTKESKEKEEKEEKMEAQPVVPAVVTQAFTKDFPGVKATWDTEDENYEAMFKLKGVEGSATYNNKGHRLETEMEIKTSELPAQVASYVAINYPGHKVTEGAKITDDKNVVTYEAEISKDGHKMDLIFDSGGKYLRLGTEEKD